MKKNIALLGFAICLSTPILAQNLALEAAPDKKNVVKPARDFVMIQVSYENWLPEVKGVDITGFGRGFSTYLMYDFPLKKFNFSFAAGLGINSQNVYFKNQVAVLNSVSDTIHWQAIDSNLYKSSKLNTTFIEMPLELRYFANKDNRNKGFKMAIGAKIGYLVGAHTKVRHAVGGTIIAEKVNTTRYMQSWRLAPTIRMGWGNFAVFGSYSITSLYKDAQGPGAYPISVGIAITGL